MLQGCAACQTKQKSPIKVAIFVWSANFHPNLKKLRKTAKKWAFICRYLSFLQIFKFWLEISAPNQLVLIPWRFWLHLTPTICPREFGTSLEVNLGGLLTRDFFETSASKVSMFGQLKFKIWGQNSKKCGFFSNG